MINPENIKIVPYETIYGKVCITPCPFKFDIEGGRPLVGSMNCEMCTSFLSKDRENKTVECIFTDFSSDVYKRKAKVKYTLARIEAKKEKKKSVINQFRKCT